MKILPFDKQLIETIATTHDTPFYLYDQEGIENNARRLLKAFSWAPGFKNFFAVKATPTPHILALLKPLGFGFDCSSYTELLMMERMGISGSEINFTSNATPTRDMQKALELGAIINLDDYSHIDFLLTLGEIPQTICMRYNPGALREGNVLIGKPEEAKYGFTREQIVSGYRVLKEKGIKHFGLHTMIASNELNNDYFIETAIMLFELAVEVLQTTGVAIEFINLGGGIGIPYRPEQEPVDYQYVSNGIREAYERILSPYHLNAIRLYMENGRVITGPYGYLVGKALHVKHTYKDYVGLDATMADLMRPGMYGAYHHITVLGKETQPSDHRYDVTGSLCENNDKFAIDRQLPLVERGDFVVIHDAGAHGHAMGFNYNGKLRSAELLLYKDKTVKEIRRAQTPDDYFASLYW